MLITIITPNFNYGKYLTETLDSVAESFAGIEYEHLVLDGKSTDCSHDILNQWQEKSKTNRWLKQDDSSQTDALKILLSEARGQWVGWLNSDEVYHVNSILGVVKAMQHSESVDVIYGDTEFVNEMGRPVRLKSLYPFSSLALKYYGPYIQTSSFFFRNPKHMNLKEIDFDSKYEFSMDWDLFMKLHRAGYKFLYKRICMSKFRIHVEAKTQKYSLEDRIYERNLIMEDFELSKRIKRGHGRLLHITLRILYFSYIKELLHFLCLTIETKGIENASKNVSKKLFGKG